MIRVIIIDRRMHWEAYASNPSRVWLVACLVRGMGACYVFGPAGRAGGKRIRATRALPPCEPMGMAGADNIGV